MLVQVKDIKKVYGSGSVYKTIALDGVSFQVDEGEFVGIMGASGSGKSTLLNLLAAIDSPESGNIFYDGKDITRFNEKELASFRKQNLGFVFQEYNLLNTLTIEENIILSLALRKMERNVIRQKSRQIAESLGIVDTLKKFPYQVSGGQRQRCACARAMVTEPKLLLADEPTGALDSKSAKTLLDTFEKINRKFHTTIIMVTHDVFSASYCDRIIFLQDGKVYREITKGKKSRKELLHEILDTFGEEKADDL